MEEMSKRISFDDVLFSLSDSYPYTTDMFEPKSSESKEVDECCLVA